MQICQSLKIAKFDGADIKCFTVVAQITQD